MPEAVSLQAAFRLPPEEAVKYFESKGYKISFDWRQVWQEEHDRVFTVAGVARDDVLFDIRKSLTAALKEEAQAWQTYSGAVNAVLRVCPALGLA